MEKKEDRRVRKTHTAVQNALLSLMEEKELSAITVQELTERADINRKTFYNHYTDIYSVVDELEDKYVASFTELLTEENVNKYMKDPSVFFEKMIWMLNRNQDENLNFFRLLTGPGVYSHLMEKVSAYERKCLKKLMEKENIRDGVWLDYFLDFFAIGSISVIKSWYESNGKVSERELAVFFESLFSSFDIRHFVESVDKS